MKKAKLSQVVDFLCFVVLLFAVLTCVSTFTFYALKYGGAPKWN